jgi:hypothetical protein
LTRTRADVIEETGRNRQRTATKIAARERIMLSYYAVVACATGTLLVWAAGQPHATATASENESGGSSVTATLAPGQSATANFPPVEITKFRRVAQDTLAQVRAGNQSGATARIKDLETAWDDDQATLQPLDDTAWTVLDGQIDSVLTAVRASNPDPATETQTLTALLTSLK